MPQNNPYRAADLRPGQLSDAFDELPTSQLVEHLRHLDHARTHRPDERARWWLSKLLSEGQRALVRRGLRPTAWLPSEGDR